MLFDVIVVSVLVYLFIVVYLIVVVGGMNCFVFSISPLQFIHL